MFYIIDSSSLQKNCYAWDNLSFQGWITTTCKHCGRSIHKAQMLEDPLEISLDGGVNYPDLLQFTGAGPRLFLLSKHALDVFTHNYITGIKNSIAINATWIDSKAHRAKKNEIPAYYSVEIEGRIDYCLSSMFLKKKKHCPVCNQFDWNRERRPEVILAKETWNGLDLCSIISAPGFQVCSQKVVDVIRANKLTGFECSLLKEK